MNQPEHGNREKVPQRVRPDQVGHLRIERRLRRDHRPGDAQVQRQGDACFCGIINRSMYAMATAEPTNVR